MRARPKLFCSLLMAAVVLPLMAPLSVAATPQAASTRAASNAQTTELAARANRAKQAMAANRFDEAAALYREILAQVPDEPGILMNLGMALAMGGHREEAIDPLSRAWTKQPTLLPAALFLGQCYLDLGKPADAIPPLQKYVTAQPANLQARQMLASAQLMTGRVREAAAEFRKVSQATPKDPKGWYGLVQAYDQLSQEAIDALSKTPEAAAYEPLLMADAAETDGKLEAAFTLYKQSLDRLPRLRSTHDALARLYQKTGHPDWAAQQTAKARTFPPSCGAGPVAATRPAARIAECEFAAKRYLSTIIALGTREDAEAQYWRTRAYAELATEALAKLTAMPPSLELYELRAELYRNQGRHQQSAAELKAAIALAPNDPRLRRELAKSQYYTRDWEAARAGLEALLKDDPKDPELQFFYGNVLLESQQAEAAVPYLQAAVDADPTQPSGHASLGRALVQLGRFAEAIPHLEAVLSQDTDGSIHYQLARAYQGTNQPDRAKPLLAKSQALQQASQPIAPATPTITPPQ